MIKNGIEKKVNDYLSFLDNSYIRLIIIICLVIYDSNIFYPINLSASIIIKNNIVQLLLIILIIAVSIKDKLIALLLTILLITSLRNYENFDNYPPLGYNSNTDCTNVNEEDLCKVEQCSGIKMFDNELGAQGLSSPVGFNRDTYSNF